MYLNNACLRIGVDQLANVDLVRHYSEYSDQYNSSMTLDDLTVRQLYKDEWFKYRLLGSYSGAYQIHVGASLFFQQRDRCCHASSQDKKVCSNLYGWS